MIGEAVVSQGDFDGGWDSLHLAPIGGNYVLVSRGLEMITMALASDTIALVIGIMNSMKENQRM